MSDIHGSYISGVPISWRFFGSQGSGNALYNIHTMQMTSALNSNFYEGGAESANVCSTLAGSGRAHNAQIEHPTYDLPLPKHGEGPFVDKARSLLRAAQMRAQTSDRNHTDSAKPIGAHRDRAAFAAKAERLVAELQGRKFGDSAEIIRADRDRDGAAP